MALSDLLVFVDQVRRGGGSIGAVIPSSRALGRRMVEGLPAAGRPRRVLEVGAGTGAFTRELVRALGPADTLVVVELNPAFCEILRGRLATWTARPDAPRVELVEGDVLAYEPAAPFEAVVSSIPFNALPEALVARIVHKLHDVLAPGGTLAYFEYTGFRTVREGVRRARGERGLSAVESELGPHVVGTRRVLWNVPPATVRQVRFEEALADGPLPAAPRPSFRAPAPAAMPPHASVLVLLAFGLLGGCRTAAPLLPSAPGPAAVDGDADEWAGGLRPVPGEPGLSIGLRNTPDALAVVIVAGAEGQARRVASGGLTLWLDPAGGTARRVGLRFPVGNGDAPVPEGPPASGPDPLREAFAAAIDRLETVRDGDVRPAAVGGVPGVETAAAWTDRGLVVEVRLPLRGPGAAAFAGEASGVSVGLGVELAEARRTTDLPAPSLTGRGRDGRVDYGADRQASQETAAPQDASRLRTPTTTTRWFEVALAP
ncbi:MAG TPA: methyltransferase domain-containing protein [Rubricoccaceae bacterium]|jgi:phospholipid N-methyltransferase